MKSKQTVLLGVLVLGIWGTIGYKIWSGLQDDDDMIPLPKIVRQVAEDENTADNYPLLLNYDDPFLRKVTLKKASPQPGHSTVRKNISRPTTPAEPVVLVQWNKIEYYGSIYNTSKKIFTASVRMDGVDYSVKEGDHIESFKIEEILRDSLKISIGKQTKYITKQK